MCGVDAALLNGGQRVVEVRIGGIVLRDQIHAIKVDEDDVRVRREHLLRVDVERQCLAGLVGQIVRADQLERAVVRLGALEAVRALERHAADVDRRLVRLGDVRRPRGEVVLNAVQVVGQLLRAVLHAEQLAQQAEGLEGVVVQRGVRSRHEDDHRDPRAALQVVRPVDVGAHDDDLRAGAQDRLRVRAPRSCRSPAATKTARS